MKVCIQAGHKGVYEGQTGASGERDWTTRVVPMIADILRKRSIEVYETDANGQDDDTVVETDWDLFLAVHYDADIYDDRGGFVDYPEPDTDYATDESQRIQKVLSEHYFKTTGIPERPSRSNANTRYYYMWQYLTPDTPCNLIECGVGWRKPEDYETLHNNIEFVAETIADGIMLALGIDVLLLDVDIPTEVEERFGLKETDRYDKYWTYEDLIKDWVNISSTEDEVIDLKQKLSIETNKLENCREEKAENERQYNKHLEEIQSTLTKSQKLNDDLRIELQNRTEERDKLEGKVEPLEQQVTGLKEGLEALEKVLRNERADYSDLEEKYIAERLKVDDLIKNVSMLEFIFRKLRR